MAIYFLSAFRITWSVFKHPLQLNLSRSNFVGRRPRIASKILIGSYWLLPQKTTGLPFVDGPSHPTHRWTPAFPQYFLTLDSRATAVARARASRRRRACPPGW